MTTITHPSSDSQSLIRLSIHVASFRAPCHFLYVHSYDCLCLCLTTYQAVKVLRSRDVLT
ncbi:hypothetical protein BGW80DRAFT_1301541 [Lactifluus volemus]|nr:hypothetical protein BGW80DRAFT_1301541 [Lactifluus volemus]